MYYVYVIQSPLTGEYYIGHAEDLGRRLNEHKLGKNRSTKKRDDWKLVYSETYESRALAMKRENYLKTGDGRKVLRNKGIIFDRTGCSSGG